ncbi:Uu.00g113850.m01.CDS01 [Anthostomella pinea]|uniref:Uu.00g113850.m01.CDS01 n=1 Tax=Anthostomella pinea TaxID=933095 RepID=A0AAI8YGL4_9PEZI|nr:Uu.00g113850.m01.CDS01 [Anthostomella pinea]
MSFASTNLTLVDTKRGDLFLPREVDYVCDEITKTELELDEAKAADTAAKFDFLVYTEGGFDRIFSLSYYSRMRLAVTAAAAAALQ